jgi:hypothetical protein
VEYSNEFDFLGRKKSFHLIVPEKINYDDSRYEMNMNDAQLGSNNHHHIHHPFTNSPYGTLIKMEPSSNNVDDRELNDGMYRLYSEDSETTNTISDGGGGKLRSTNAV